MASIAIKKRESQVEGKAGRLFVQVIQQRKARIESLPWWVYPDEWDIVKRRMVIPAGCSEARSRTLFDIQQAVDKEQRVLEDIVTMLQARGSFTAADVLNEYRKRNKYRLLQSFADRRVHEFLNAGQFSTAHNYLKAVKRFIDFVGNEDLSLEEINAERLMSFTLYLQQEGLKNNSISSYLRVLRALWNLAINQGLLPMQPSPFRTLFTGVEKTRKRAVSESVIQQLALLSDQLTEGLRLGRDMFLFSFYARGMAFVDLAHLTKDNLKGDYLVYNRRKTKQEVRIKLHSSMIEILECYRDNGTPYLFPALKGIKQDYREYDSALRLQNKRLKKLAALLCVPHLVLTTYVARHSWASIANEKGVPLEVISQGLAHTSTKITYIYISHIDNYLVDEANELIVSACTMQLQKTKQVND